ncbi:LOW QUALITY PROTEIN: 4-galactosyl-N-acetylglucosaminide 3-alpha-L-fucosyltransferase FUT5-like [Pelodytes ibericus]
MMPVTQPTSYCRYAVVFLIQATFAFIFFSYLNINGNSQDTPETQISTTTTPKERKLIILLWTWPFGSQFPLNQCPESAQCHDCFFTANRSFYDTADAVVFHHRDVCNSKKQMPQFTQPPGQYWVWLSLESPSHSPNLDFMDNLINITMSYRSDSDIFSPYGWLEKNDIIQNFTIPEKTKLAAWVVSNWNPRSKRVQFYEELKKYVTIDVYGRQHMSLPMESTLVTLSKYKFYFAFENSQHKDYITEKLWKNALMSGTVPVVLGTTRDNYEKFIPRDSFIHVDDFPSAKEFGAYLLDLDKNNQRYQQYFSWRSRLWPQGSTNWATHYCRVCKAIKDGPAFRTIPSISKWFT